MDENKDVFSLDEENTTIDPNLDTIDTEEAAGELAQEELAQEELAEEAPAMGEADELPALPEQKSVLNRTIVVSAVIVGVVLLVAIVCRLFFANGILGASFTQGKTAKTWLYSIDTTTGAAATSDEAPTVDYYFDFEPNGKLKIHLGSFTYNGTYKLQRISQKDADETASLKDKTGESIINIENTGGMIDGKFFYATEGNAFSTQTLTLTNIYSDEVKLVMKQAEFKPAEIQREGEFKGDDKIVGDWSYKNEMVSQTISFKSDGSYTVKSSQATGVVYSYSGLYSVSDGKITMSYIDAAQQSLTLKYSVKDDKFNLYQQAQTLDSKTGKIKTVEQPLAFTKVK